MSIRPPLKKKLFPVQRPGDFITAEWELFFFILPIFFFWSRFHNFLTKKKEKKNFAAARLATISPTRYTGNKLFFKGGLIQAENIVGLCDVICKPYVKYSNLCVISVTSSA